jgi:hypothetical protein
MAANPSGKLAKVADKAGDLVGGLRGRRGDDRSGEAVTARQTVTFGRGRERLAELFQDPIALSRIAGEVASVEQRGATHWVWSFKRPGGDRLIIESELAVLSTGLLWTAVADEGQPSHSAKLDFVPAPNELGTEVTLQIEAHPGPALPEGLTQLALGGALLKALHRAKALVETGEIPTLSHNPAARNGGSDHDDES